MQFSSFWPNNLGFPVLGFFQNAWKKTLAYQRKDKEETLAKKYIQIENIYLCLYSVQ